MRSLTQVQTHLFLAGINLYLATLDQRQLFSLSPRLERVLDLSIMAFLFSTERFASDRSAVTRVMEILKTKRLITSRPQTAPSQKMTQTCTLFQK